MAHRTQTGITRREYDAYMNGATQASGLTLEDPVSFDEPVSLGALRGLFIHRRAIATCEVLICVR